MDYKIGDKLLCKMAAGDLIYGIYYTIYKISEDKEGIKIWVQIQNPNSKVFIFKQNLSKYFDTLYHVRKLKLEKINKL